MTQTTMGTRTNEGATGAIVGTSVVSVQDQIDQQGREDIFDCLLHAEQFASHHFDPREDYCNWLFRYRTRLEARGLQLINPITHAPKVIFETADLDAVTFDITHSVGDRALADLALASWRSMKGHLYAERFLSHGLENGELARFQVVPCTLDTQGRTQMLICAIRLTGTVDNRDFDLWTQTRREMLLRVSGGVYRFDRTVYAKYRTQIREQLLTSSDDAIQHYVI